MNNREACTWNRAAKIAEPLPFDLTEKEGKKCALLHAIFQSRLHIPTHCDPHRHSREAGFMQSDRGSEVEKKQHEKAFNALSPCGSQVCDGARASVQAHTYSHTRSISARSGRNRGPGTMMRLHCAARGVWTSRRAKDKNANPCFGPLQDFAPHEPHARSSRFRSSHARDRIVTFPFVAAFTHRLRHVQYQLNNHDRSFPIPTTIT